MWTATATNIAGVREGGGVRVVTTILKFVPLRLIAVVGLCFIKAGNYHPFTVKHSGDRGINGAAALTLWAFIGLGSATVAGGEIRNPGRTLPRATIYGTLAATLLYLIATIAIFGMIPTHKLAGSNSPFAAAANVARARCARRPRSLGPRRAASR